MRIFYTVILVAIFVALNAQTTLSDSLSQDKTSQVSSEIYFKFTLNDQIPLEKLTRMISIDDFDHGICFAFANNHEFDEFKKLGISYEILPNPGSLLKDIKMLIS